MIDILYEHPSWFARLFEALDARGVPYRRVHAASLRFAPDWKHDPAAREAAPDLLVNRMSPSADRRGHGHGILPTLQYLESAEAGGVRVINGSKAYGFEISKARQMALLADLGLPFPKTRVINSAAEALAATEGLRWPVVVKPSVGGSGAGVLRFDRRATCGPRSRPDSSTSAWTISRSCRSSSRPGTRTSRAWRCSTARTSTPSTSR